MMKTSRTILYFATFGLAGVVACSLDPRSEGDDKTIKSSNTGDNNTGGGGGDQMGGGGSAGEDTNGILNIPMGGDGNECDPTLGACDEIEAICGDGILQDSEEECDDGNTTANDGCSAVCLLEPGWICPIEAAACQAALCGDGIKVDIEQCDDGNTVAGDGCDETCGFEKGYICPTDGALCMPTDCGNGVKEGSEPCDDGNNDTGDGCTPFCEIEPDCSGITTTAGCTSPCGDGVILAANNDEECDDGNTLDGDGCSSTCKVEDGWMCEIEDGQLPDVLEVPVTFRDFIAMPTNGGVRHPDFEVFSGSAATLGMVEDTIGNDGNPVYTGVCEQGGPNIGNTTLCPYDEQSTSEANFDQWYNDTDGVNIPLVTTLAFSRVQGSTYSYIDNALFPLNGAGWVQGGKENTNGNNNFGFTSEIRYWFEYSGGEMLTFNGDDDLWVFINGHLAVDVGGLHSKTSGSVTLNAAAATNFNLQAGKIYEISLFHAERHCCESNFELTLGGFVTAHSTCKTICGDGIITRDEACDDGVNDGSYGGCNPDCSRGPICGDGDVTAPQEGCDDGNRKNGDGCSANCVKEAIK